MMLGSKGILPPTDAYELLRCKAAHAIEAGDLLDSVKSILFVAATCREWKQLMSDILIIIDVVMMSGSKGVWPHMIHGLLRISCSRNPTDAYELLRCEAAPAILQTFEIR